jgi:hypothetical protein
MGAMSWAQDLLGFGGAEEVSSAGPASLDQARFGYSPELVGNLKGDHAYLLRRYREIEQLALKGELVAIPMALAGFKNKFDLHLLNENLQFYCHLEQRSARRPSDLARIKEFRTEMNTIARVVVNFVKKYRLEGVSPAGVQAFLNELRAVGAALMQRIEREEKDLYPLYAP